MWTKSFYHLWIKRSTKTTPTTVWPLFLSEAPDSLFLTARHSTEKIFTKRTLYRDRRLGHTFAARQMCCLSQDNTDSQVNAGFILVKM
ncbi:hypothetical protein AOLI_G00008260 [Acnodon oligacanthus]